MSDDSFEFEVSFEDEIDECVTVDVTYYAGDPGKCYGPPENCYPPEPPSFDIENPRIVISKGRKQKSRPLTEAEFKAIGVEDADALAQLISKEHEDSIHEHAAERSEDYREYEHD